MRLFDALIAVFQHRLPDVGCALATNLPVWAGDGALAYLALAGVLAWLTAWTMRQALRPARLRRTLGSGAYLAWAAAARCTARWGRGLAVWWAAWLDAHELPQAAVRVRAVNGLAA